MVFVDTSAWYALNVTSDARHGAAWTWWTGNDLQPVTTDYIIDELLTLLRRRGHIQRATLVGRRILELPDLRVERISTVDFDEAWVVFQRFQDKRWSFTDCTSRVVMARLSVGRAFAFDEHFRQFGTVTVVPAV